MYLISLYIFANNGQPIIIQVWGRGRAMLTYRCTHARTSPLLFRRVPQELTNNHCTIVDIVNAKLWSSKPNPAINTIYMKKLINAYICLFIIYTNYCLSSLHSDSQGNSGP